MTISFSSILKNRSNIYLGRIDAQNIIEELKYFVITGSLCCLKTLSKTL